MGWTQKKTIRIAVCLLLVISLLFNEIPLYARAEEHNEKERAVQWLAAVGGEDREWGDSGLPNLTCNAMAVLREEGKETDSPYLEQWEQVKNELNVDELAHLVWAWKEKSYLDSVWNWQNADGGFGLTKEYTSDIYDTLLVLLAEAAVKEDEDLAGTEENAGQESNPLKVWAAVNYLIGRQRMEGGFGYTDAGAVSPVLSAQVGIVLLMLDAEEEAVYEKLDSYCAGAFQADFSEETFYEQAELARYLYRRNKIENSDDIEEKLYAIQKEDGSIYGSVADTIQYILLLNEIQEYHTLKLKVDSLVTEADTYVLEAGSKQPVALQTTVCYTVNQEMEGIIRYTLLEDGVIIKTEEKACIFVPDQTEQMAETVMDITAEEEKEYILRTELLSRTDEEDETVWMSAEFTFTVHKTEEKEFILEAETLQGEEYAVNLLWNDISNGDNRYGYRVFRKKGDDEWETRSTWDGSERVRVLNVHPFGANYLKTWMYSTISASEEIASRGVLEIDEVVFSVYNDNPDAYLRDEKGNYKYDVIMIGSADCNGWCDLSDTAYEATLAFTETGRGILFGHDSVVDNADQVHRNLAKFGEQLGFAYYKPGTGASGTRVEVINTGFLTSYPWKLTGTLTIPYTHTSGQSIDTTLANPATKWIKFQGFNGNDDAYLSSRNQYAMIQTGHSNGQATDDERKIIANTLFYLKQLTNKTSATDKSFYDEAAPEITDVSEVTADSQITIRAKDNGTLYQYYVEAVNAGAGENRTSNIVEAEALSGVRGFIIGISDSEGQVEELLTYDEAGNLTSEVLPSENGSLDYTIPELNAGENAYLHIYVVDNAGNISEEIVKKVTMPEQKPEVSDKGYFKLPYALFADEGEVQLYCSEANIAGDIYGAETFRFQGSTIHMPDTISTSGTLSIAGGWLDIAEQEEGVEKQYLPDYMPVILSDMEAEGDPLEELNAYDSTNITHPTICKTTTGTWCSNVVLAASLVSGDKVSLNGDTITCGTDSPVVLGSENGDISIQATFLSGQGLIYAPNGTVTINVSEFNYTGTIVAKRIVIQAGNYNQNQ